MGVRIAYVNMDTREVNIIPPIPELAEKGVTAPEKGVTAPEKGVTAPRTKKT